MAICGDITSFRFSLVRFFLGASWDCLKLLQKSISLPQEWLLPLAYIGIALTKYD